MGSFILSLLHSSNGAHLSLGFGKEGLSSPPETDRFVFLEPVHAPSVLQPNSPNTSQAQADEELEGNRLYHGGEALEASEHLGKVGWREKVAPSVLPSHPYLTP